MPKKETESLLDRSYPSLKNYDDALKAYLKDMLEMRRQIEVKLLADVLFAYKSCIGKIADVIAEKTGEFKGINAPLKKLIEKEKSYLAESLKYIIYATLQRGAAVSLSVGARLNVDEQLHKQKLQEKAVKGEMLLPIINNSNLLMPSIKERLIGELKGAVKDKNIIIKKEQLRVAEKSEEIARHTMEKVRIFREKEFKLSSRIWGVSDNSINKVKELIEAGINKDCKKLALALKDYISEGGSKLVKDYPNMVTRLRGRFPKNLPFAAMRLARNELSENAFITSLKDYIENPYVEAVQWLLANNRLKMYEDRCCCNDLAYENVYGLGCGIYPLDKVPDRPHVMCLCTIAPITSRKLQKQLEGGMKLGNVPTTEWFEKQNHELNKKMIQDKLEETGLRVFHNEDSRALAVASIDIIKEHRWFQNGVRAEDKEDFISDLHKVNSRALFILARHTKNMQGDFYNTKEASFYSLKENKIYCNLKKDSLKKDNQALGFKLGMSTFLHESGHWLDSNIFETSHGLTQKMNNLFTLIEYDVISYINKIGYEKYKNNFKLIRDLESKTIKNLDTELRKLITNIIAENKDINSDISDLYGAMTHEEIAGRVINKLYGHTYAYWQRENKAVYSLKVQAETIAEMFESLGNIERIQSMRQFLPNAWAYFNRQIDSIF
ncbi:MAG: hypothetical protein ACTTKH_08460 [Treponema sp.]